MLWNSPALKSTNFKSNLLSSINKVLSSSAKIRVQWAGQKDSKLTVVRLSALQIHLAFKSLQKCFTHQQSTLECVKADTTLPHLPPHFTYLYKDVKCNAIVSPSHRVNYFWKRSFFSYLAAVGARWSHITNDAFGSHFGSTGMTYRCCVKLCLRLHLQS